MADHPLSDEDRETPPYLLAMLTAAGARAERALRRAIASVPTRVLMFLWAAGTIGLFVFVVFASIAQTPGWEGVLGGIAGGGFLALLFAAAVGGLLLWARPRSERPLARRAAAAAPDPVLAPTLRELNAVRATIATQVRSRSVSRIPLGMAAAALVWVLAQWTDDPPGVVQALIFLGVGALAGEAWAYARLDRGYRRLYKSRVLPVLAGRFGALTYKPATADEVRALRAFRILPDFDWVHAEDEIAGEHRGLGLRIIEARLRKRSGNDTRTVFDGLLIEITLPRSLTGTTAVLADEGVFGNLKARWQTADMESVRLEDPAFERRFEVYSDDQIEARALLTPAFMERFTALAASSGFALPGAVAQGNRLLVALPKTVGAGNLFEPPPYWKPAGGQALTHLERDIAAVLSVADTVVALDFWAAGRVAERRNGPRAGGP